MSWPRSIIINKVIWNTQNHEESVVYWVWFKKRNLKLYRLRLDLGDGVTAATWLYQLGTLAATLKAVLYFPACPLVTGTIHVTWGMLQSIWWSDEVLKVVRKVIVKPWTGIYVASIDLKACPLPPAPVSSLDGEIHGIDVPKEQLPDDPATQEMDGWSSISPQTPFPIVPHFCWWNLVMNPRIRKCHLHFSRSNPWSLKSHRSKAHKIKDQPGHGHCAGLFADLQATFGLLDHGTSIPGICFIPRRGPAKMSFKVEQNYETLWIGGTKSADKTQTRLHRFIYNVMCKMPARDYWWHKRRGKSKPAMFAST